MGFLTKAELNTSKTFSSIDNPTNWQKRELIRLFARLVIDQDIRMYKDDKGFEECFEISRTYFLHGENKEFEFLKIMR